MEYNPRKSQVRQRLILIVKLAIAVGLIYWLISSGQLNFSQLTELGDRWHWFLLAQIPFGLVQLLSAWRWRLFMKIQGINYTVRDTFDLTIIGIFFNQILIGSTGGDVYRAYAVCVEHPDRRSGAVVSVFADRAAGLVALLTLVPVALLWNADLVRNHASLSSFAAILIVTLLVVIVTTTLLFSNSFRRLGIVRWVVSRLPLANLLKQIDEAIVIHRHHSGAMILMFAVSVIIQLLVIVCNVFLALALLAPPLDWLAFLLMIPMAHLAMAVPINPPGAIGTAEAIYAYLFGLAGITQGALICVLQRATFLLWSIPGALLYIMRRQPTINRSSSLPQETGYSGPANEQPGKSHHSGT